MAAGSPQPEVGPQDVDDAAGPHADGEAAHTDQDTLILDNLTINNLNQGAESVSLFIYICKFTVNIT